MDPREFRTLASALASMGTPAANRTAISRAYYSAFNVGVEKLRDLGFNVRRGAAAHGEVLHCLGNAGDPEAASAESKLSDLHTQRNRADYQLDKLDVERAGTAAAALGDAITVIEVLDRLFGGPLKPRLHAAIAAWRQANGYR